MTAKIYSVVSPVIAAKLFDKGVEVKENSNVLTSNEFSKFFAPFIEDGKLNAKVIIGDTTSHGRFDSWAYDFPFGLELVAIIGKLLTEISFPIYKLDIEIDESDLKDNLILLGNIKTNSIIDKINEKLPIKFDTEGREFLVSTITERKYSDPRIGLIAKIPNPFNGDKQILVIGGVARRGMRAASSAITKHISKINLNIKKDGSLLTVVQGLDEDGNGMIDNVKFLE
jgi:hypothetical protein